MASISRRVPIHLGLDVHKDTISVEILPADQQVPDVERITHDEASIRRLLGLWVPETRSWMLSCEFVGELIGPR